MAISFVKKGGRILIYSKKSNIFLNSAKNKYSFTQETEPSFGLFFDIDGVITRGKTLLPHSKAAFKLLTNELKNFKIPSIFVTNAGNNLRQNKAKQLSDLLDVNVEEDQVIMSHSPLRMFQQFLDKHMLVSGQGPTEEISKSLGFTKVTTLEKFRSCFPKLDTNDYKRRKAAPCAFEGYFPKIEGIVLFGEPVSWETSLQIIIDVLLSNGKPSKALSYFPYPHLPILACNMDFVWMAEAPMPRFGHGCFMTCLETLYKKLTSNDLQYIAKLGKPSEITYHYAEHVMQMLALKMNKPILKTIYCIGDNPATDIFGSNLFNRRIQRLALMKKQQQQQQQQKQKQKQQQKQQQQEAVFAEIGKFRPHLTSEFNNNKNFYQDQIQYNQSFNSSNSSSTPHPFPPPPPSPLPPPPPSPSPSSSSLSTLFSPEFYSSTSNVSIERCESILVCTGVFDKGRAQINEDHIMDENLCTPSFATVHNVLEAVQAVLERERVV